MKFNFLIWYAATKLLKNGLKKIWRADDVENLIRRAKPVYKNLLLKIDGISEKNPMAHNIYLSFVFISIWLASERKISCEKMSEAIGEMLSWKPLKWFYGRIDLNTEKGVKTFGRMMKKCADYAENHPEEKNAWDFHFDEKIHADGFYYYFTHCPINDFCKKFGYEEFTPVLCKIDFTTMGMMHSVLHREQTLADGGKICDYWTVGDGIENPE